MIRACVVFLTCVLVNTCCTGVEGGRFDPSKVKPLGEPPRRLFDKEDIIQYHGYKVKKYEVITEDEYILGVSRILKAEGGPPVLFVNGFGVSPSLWVLHGSGHDLHCLGNENYCPYTEDPFDFSEWVFRNGKMSQAYVLADLGYDCWIGGTRGMEESTKHMNLNITAAKYWDFSNDEIGLYDLPAMIDLVRKETGYKKILFAGVSLAGTFLMAMCNDRPEYCSYLAANVLFAPGMYIPQQSDFSSNRSLLIIKLPILVKNIYNNIQVNSIQMNSVFSESFLSLCYRYKAVQRLISIAFRTIFNLYEENIAPGWLCPTAAHLKWSISLRQLKHIYQLFISGGIDKYDYGEEKNLEVYGRSKPPSYNLSRIISPTLVCLAENDQIVPLGIMKKQLRELGNVKSVLKVTDPTYGHLDLTYGKDINKYIFSDIVDFLDNISGLK